MWWLVLIGVHALGAATAVHLIYRGNHQSRGALAWVIALLGAPWLALPVYWLSGQVRYDHYANSQRISRQAIRSAVAAGPETDDGTHASVGRHFSLFGYQAAATLELLIDGERTFDAILDAIGGSKRYVLVQSYLVRDDVIGRRLAEALTGAVDRGCRALFLYDELGSFELSKSYLSELRQAGVEVRGFTVRRRLLPRFRANFRNHRKTVVVDGTTGFVGGLNIGDEHVHGGCDFADWRDTHLRIEGCAVAGLQAAFVEDWQFAGKDHGSSIIAELHWQPYGRDGEVRDVCICSIGPQEKTYSGELLFTDLVQTAKERLWIATPYFVPDDRIIAAIKVAALRGVDVRVLVPQKSDHAVFRWVHREVAAELGAYGIQIFSFQPGFMHQKVLLVDRTIASIGSANFDNRSFRLNFEQVALVERQALIVEVERMLQADFERAERLTVETERSAPVWRTFFSRACRLLAPVL